MNSGVLIKKKTKRRVMLVVAIVILLINLCGILLAYIPSQMSESHTNKIVNLYFEDTGYSLDSFNNKWKSKVEECTVTSAKGHVIPVTYICSEGNYENNTIILVHWHEANHSAMFPIAEIFLEKGWNVVMYDQRAHGKNTANTVTFGYLESLDLQEVVDFTYQKSKGSTVGALGQSMGAATIAYYSGTEHSKKYLDFAIIDSAFSGMYEEIYWEISKAKVPLPSKALTTIGSEFSKLLYGYKFSDVNIVKQIGTNSIPTLVMHSKKDNKCPYYMGKELYESIPHSNKMLITFESSEHLFSFWDEKKRYIDEVFLFIDKCNLW